MSARDLVRRLPTAFHRAARFLSPPERVDGLVAPLVVAAVASFLLLGIAIRAGSVAPRGPGTDLAFQGMLAVGVVAYNAAFLIGALLLALWAWGARGGDPGFAASVVALLVLALAAPVAGGGAWMSAAVAVLVASLVLLLAVRALRKVGPPTGGRRAARVAAWGFVAAVASAVLFVAAGHVGNAVAWSGVSAAFGLAELAAVAAACLAPWGLACAFRGRTAVAAGIAGALVILLALRSPLVPLIATWSLGFSMHLPIPVYALGVTGLTYALAERLPRERLQGNGAGLLLLVVAGIGMRTTAEALLLVAGALLLFTPRAVPQAAEATGPAPRSWPAGAARPPEA